MAISIFFSKKNLFYFKQYKKIIEDSSYYISEKINYYKLKTKSSSTVKYSIFFLSQK